jgi:aspartyl-tRNA synthetase
VFLDLRDRYGITQVVVESDDKDVFATAQDLGREFCLAVQGTVRARLPGKTNPAMTTGAVEVKASAIHILNHCPTPPFPVTEFPDEELANEDLRLQYRYLDLRRPTLQRIFALRHRMIKAIRDNLSAQGFLEIETPFLGRSTPEGARDYLVPSRLHSNSCSWSPVTINTSKSRAACATRTRGPTASRSLPSLTSRCRLSSRIMSSPSSKG